MRKEDLLKRIPFFPKGVSREHLAIEAGYIKKPFTRRRIEKGLAKLDKDIDWLTLRDETLVQRTERLQLSTQAVLKSESFPVEMMDPDCCVYLSKLKGKK